MDADFWSFRKMITPVVIQMIFWIGLAGNALWALMLLIGFSRAGGFMGFLGGLVVAAIAFVVGAFFTRIWCELIILLFRIYDELKAIREGRPPTDQGFPVINPTPVAPVAPPPPPAAPAI